MGNERGRPGDIPSKAFEEKLVGMFGNAALALGRLGVADPVYISCTLVNVKDYSLSRDGISFYQNDVQHKFDRHVIRTPDLQIDRTERPPYQNTLLPIVDSIWQANGYEETPWLQKWGLDGRRRPISRE